MRLAVILSHPIPHFAPWHRELARRDGIDLRVFFCCDWGLAAYVDPQFQMSIQWDVPLVEGYPHEFLPIARSPRRLTFWEVDNPTIGKALDGFDPDVVQVFGYAHRTNWRVAGWTRLHRRPLLLYSDSNAKSVSPLWKRALKRAVVGRFYDRVDGALFVGDNNLAYHLRYGLPRDRLFPCVLPIDRDTLLEAVPDRQAARRAIREGLGIPADAFVAMFCGKLASHKRPLDLVAATHAAGQQGLPLYAILVGEGPERGPVEDFIRAERVENVRLVGFVNQSAIAAYFAASDVVAVVSDRDNHPLVVSEGATFGCPVVISDRVGCIGENDTARPGANALVYPCGDREALRLALERLYRDGELRARMSAESLRVSMLQDAAAAAEQLETACLSVRRLGPRTKVRAC